MDDLATTRLWLRPLTLRQLQIWLHDPAQFMQEVGVQLADNLLSEAAHKATYAKIKKMRRVRPHWHPWYTYWLLTLKTEPLGVGLVGFKGAPDERGKVEIGYGIAPTFGRQGLMTEAVQELAAWALSQTVCRVVVAETAVDNLPSHRVLTKSGFQVTGKTAEQIYWQCTHPVRKVKDAF